MIKQLKIYIATCDRYRCCIKSDPIIAYDSPKGPAGWGVETYYYSSYNQTSSRKNLFCPECTQKALDEGAKVEILE